MKKRRGSIVGRVTALVLLSLILFSLSGCTMIENLTGSSDVYCLDEINSAYNEVIAHTLPGYSVGRTSLVYPFLQQKSTTAAEAFDPQALPALEHGVAGYWYPQYLATVIIAVDREKTDAVIRGWSDLYAVEEEVGIIGVYSYTMVFSAISYGLEGEKYTFAGAADLLAGLRKKGFLHMDSSDPGIVICYDYQAAAMINSGRDVEIIIPCEGTFSYERGLLSHVRLSFVGDMDSLLVSSGFRLADGRCDDSLYPVATAYESAVRVSNYDHFGTVGLDGDRIFRRAVLKTRLYSSADGREHQLFPLLYMILSIVWIASVFRRAMQKSVRRAALLTGIILLGWMTVRLVKFQIIDETMLGLGLWFSYYLFQLSLPLVALLLADSIDRPDDSRVPKWLLVPAILNGAFLLLVFTSHLHGFVFRIDFSSPNWAADYSYGPGFTAIQFVNYALLGLAVVVMMIKCGRSLRKKGFLFPITFLVLLVLYAYGYSTQIPIARDSDITMVTGLFTLLFFESAIRTGLIPVNTKYADFFTHTTLRIQITDSDKKAVLSSEPTVEYSPDALAGAIASQPLPLTLGENTLLFSSGIQGGNVFWQEDITGLNRLHAEIVESVNKLSAANAMLAEDEKIKRILAEENEKERIMTQLEAEIAGHTEKLSAMARQMKSPADFPNKTAEIAILLCYVKRRCNLFFRERETRAILPGELTGYLDEMAGIAAYSDTKIIVSSDIKESLSVRHATLFYDFFYRVIEWAASQSCPHVMVHFREGNGNVIMRLLPYASPNSFTPDAGLLTAISSNGGVFAMKNLDDAAAISLSFPQGGEADD